MSNETMALTPEVLKDLLSAVLAEAKKPAPLTEKEIADQKQDLQMRKDTALSNAEVAKSKRDFQRICTHQHKASAGGGTHCVHIREERGHGYILCQYCQARVRPEIAEAERADHEAHYDSRLFNLLFQSCVTTGGEILG